MKKTLGFFKDYSCAFIKPLFLHYMINYKRNNKTW